MNPKAAAEEVKSGRSRGFANRRDRNAGDGRAWADPRRWRSHGFTTTTCDEAKGITSCLKVQCSGLWGIFIDRKLENFIDRKTRKSSVDALSQGRKACWVKSFPVELKACFRIGIAPTTGSPTSDSP